MKGIIFNTEKEAVEFDKANNHLPKHSDDVTQYWFPRVALAQTTALSKAEYAEYEGIPATKIEIDNDGNENEIANPDYESLKDSYTLNKYALIVGDTLDVYDDEGNLVGYANPITGQTQEELGVQVVEISEEDLFAGPDYSKVDNKDYV